MINGWKVTAIIFISLFIVETILFISLIKIGLDAEQEDLICSIEVCSEYGSYYYDSINRICSCYINGEVEYQEILNP